MNVKSFVFNSFQENTYVLYDESKECIIIDPGCNNVEEQNELNKFIVSNDLVPKKLINTHCHIDHVLGNKFIAESYRLKVEAHKGEEVVLQMCTVVSQMYGIVYNPSPPIEIFIADGETIRCGGFELISLFTPGHSPASLSFYNRKDKILIAGDVLFKGSIGRTDLPGGNYQTLINSIKEQIFPLEDEVLVFPGHGPATTVGEEKKYNPFLQ